MPNSESRVPPAFMSKKKQQWDTRGTRLQRQESLGETKYFLDLRQCKWSAMKFDSPFSRVQHSSRCSTRRSAIHSWEPERKSRDTIFFRSRIFPIEIWMKLSKENRFATALCALAEQTIYSTLLSIFNKQIEKIGKFTFVGSFVDDDSSDIGSEDFSMQCLALFPKCK